MAAPNRKCPHYDPVLDRRPDVSRIDMVHPLVAAALRKKSGMERLRLAHEEWRLTRDRLTGFLASRYPEWDAARVRLEVARRFLGGSG
jgi:hypothetical protein